MYRAGEPESKACAAALRKVRRRIIPFLITCYLAAYLDRVNVGFAALTMNSDLGIGPEAYGFTAGIFFLGYCLFEVPSNLLLDRFGARLWIARIMITWGFVSAAMAFVTDAWSLGFVRFLLGVAEAGFFPGIIYYLTRWVPAEERAAIISLFMTAVPVSIFIGSPISGVLLDAMDGVAGLKGWQWLFVIEAVPSVLLGIAVLFLLTDRIEEAQWLDKSERDALSATIARDAARAMHSQSLSVGQTLAHPRILLLSIIYFGLASGLYGLTFWLPQIVKNFGFSNTATGFMTAVPYLAGAMAMTAWGRHSDQRGERVWHIAIPCFAGGAGLIGAAFVQAPVIALASLTLSAVGIFAALPTFWTLPSAMLTGAAAAAGIALINAIGNIGGFAGPYVVGALKQHGLSGEAAVASLAAVAMLSGLLVLVIGHSRRPAFDRPTAR